MGWVMAARHLYELCPICDGAGAIDPARIAGLDRLRKPRADGKIECPGCAGDRFVKTGLTAAQVQGIIAENDRLKGAAR